MNFARERLELHNAGNDKSIADEFWYRIDGLSLASSLQPLLENCFCCLRLCLTANVWRNNLDSVTIICRLSKVLQFATYRPLKIILQSLIFLLWAGLHCDDINDTQISSEVFMVMAFSDMCSKSCISVESNSFAKKRKLTRNQSAPPSSISLYVPGKEVGTFDQTDVEKKIRSILEIIWPASLLILGDKSNVGGDISSNNAQAITNNNISPTTGVLEVDLGLLLSYAMMHSAQLQCIHGDGESSQLMKLMGKSRSNTRKYAPNLLLRLQQSLRSHAFRTVEFQRQPLLALCTSAHSMLRAATEHLHLIGAADMSRCKEYIRSPSGAQLLLVLSFLELACFHNDENQVMQPQYLTLILSTNHVVYVPLPFRK